MKHYLYNYQIVTAAIRAAIKGHDDTNHRYGDASYTVHLSHVVDVAQRFKHLVKEDELHTAVAACWLHDSIEDARMSYNDVKKLTNKDIAEIVRAVTNYTRGRNRNERMPDFIYEDIRNTPLATYVKLCDRIANIETGGKTDMYARENEHFVKMIYNENYKEMFDYIDHLIQLSQTP
jgi:(p)ppGpp synthase/HD superfamily hydrolase